MSESMNTEITESSPGLFARTVPESKLGSAALGLALSVPLGVLATVLSIYGFHIYGYVLFCFVPLSVGLKSTLVYGYHRQRSFTSCLAVSQIAIGLVGVALFLFAIEGLICLVMALPLAMPLSAFGALVGWTICNRYFSSNTRTGAIVTLVLGLPLMMGFEDRAFDEPHLIEVTTEVAAEAPPEVVWEHLIDAASLPAADRPLFRRGVGHPTELRLEGEGPGATLAGEFSTGPFEVAIDEWDAPNRLAMSVTEHPPTMEEWSIYGEIDAPHLVDYFACDSGEIELEATPNGTTVLRGTTRCHQELGPSAYWTVWSKSIIDRLHQRVLEDVAHRSQVDPSVAGSDA